MLTPHQRKALLDELAVIACEIERRDEDLGYVLKLIKGALSDLMKRDDPEAAIVEVIEATISEADVREGLAGSGPMETSRLVRQILAARDNRLATGRHELGAAYKKALANRARRRVITRLLEVWNRRKVAQALGCAYTLVDKVYKGQTLKG